MRTDLARPVIGLGALVALACTVVVVSLSQGVYEVPLLDVVRILTAEVTGASGDWEPSAATAVVDVRLPRVLLGFIVGAGLAVSGTMLQAVFRNPIVNPQIIGVSSGASLGGVIAITAGLGTVALVGASFLSGLLALLLVFLVSRGAGGSSTVTIVLSGVVVGALFSALVSLVTYLADPYSELQAIVFWLLGSLASATSGEVALAVGPVAAGCAVALVLRWRLNLLSLGDDDARSLGVRPGVLRWSLLVVVALVVAACVSVSGVIGWVGLVVPHLVRSMFGPDHRWVVPGSIVLGGTYLCLIDMVTRVWIPGELPIGVLTAVIGAPVFLMLLRVSRRRAWADA